MRVSQKQSANLHPRTAQTKNNTIDRLLLAKLVREGVWRLDSHFTPMSDQLLYDILFVLFGSI